MAIEPLTNARAHARCLLRLAQEGNGEASRELLLYMADRLGDLDSTEREALRHALTRLTKFDHDKKRTAKVNPANAFMREGRAACSGAQQHKRAMSDIAVLHAVEQLRPDVGYEKAKPLPVPSWATEYAFNRAELIWKALPGLCIAKDTRRRKKETLCNPQPEIVWPQYAADGYGEQRAPLQPALESIARALHDGIEGKSSKWSKGQQLAVIERVRRAYERGERLVAPFTHADA